MKNSFLYKTYRIFYRTQNWRKRRFTLPGILVLITLLMSASLGIDTSQSTIYQIFTFFLPLLFVSIIWSVLFHGQISAKRELPKFATVGEPFSYEVRFHNYGAKRQAGLSFFERTADPRPDYETLINSKEPGEEQRNIWDRKILYYRWLWLIHKNQKIHITETKIPPMHPNEHVTARAKVIPMHRGYLRLQAITVTCPDPFGLFKSFLTIPTHQTVLILPKRYPLPEVRLPGNRKYHSGGVALASSVGTSDEFISLRHYQPGDPLRQIHWKSCAKTDELIIRENQDEFFVRHALILDTFTSDSNSMIFEEAVCVAASFICGLHTEESLLDLMFVGDQAYCFSSGRGMSHMEKMLEILACVQTCSNRSFASLKPLIINHASLLSGCICILLAWDEERKQLIDALHVLSVPMIVLIIVNDTDPSIATLPDMPSGIDRVHFLTVGHIAEGLTKI